MNDVLTTIYIVSFAIGPAYFALNVILAKSAGNNFNDFEGDIEFDGFEVDDFSNIDVVDGFDLDVAEVDLPDVDMDMDMDTVEVDADVDAEIDTDVENFHSLKVSFFSPRIWVSIFTGFGFGGFFSLKILDNSGGTSLAVATMVGVLAGAFLFPIISYLYAHTSRNDPPLRIVGRKGKVTLSIPYKKVGLVRIDYVSGNQEYRATSRHRRQLKKGETVRVVKYIRDKQLLIVRETK